MIISKRVTSISEKCIPPEGYIAINVLSWHPKDTKYYTLSPYHLRTDGKEEQKNDGGVLFENVWQSAKLYETVESIQCFAHPSQRTNPWWSYVTNGKEKHLDENNNVLPAYYNWRNSLWKCQKPIRYPVGRKNAHLCKFALLNDEKLDYLQSRKRLYGQEYKRLIKKLPEYQDILDLLCEGKKICIFEIDVPSPNKKVCMDLIQIVMVSLSHLNKSKRSYRRSTRTLWAWNFSDASYLRRYNFS